MRAANTGISAGFDAKGHELGRVGTQMTGILSLRLPSSVPVPFYARIGLLLPGGVALICMLVAVLIRPRRRPL